MEEMCFSRFLKMGKDLAARIELGQIIPPDGNSYWKSHVKVILCLFGMVQ